MDRALEPSLDDGLEKVTGTHGGAACGKEQVGFSEAFGDGLDVCVDARILIVLFNSVVSKEKMVSLVGYYPEINDRVSHPFECCLQRGAVGIVYPTPSVAGKWIWRFQIHDFVTRAQNGHHRFASHLDLCAYRRLIIQWGEQHAP